MLDILNISSHRHEEDEWRTSIYKRGSFIILGRAKLYNGLAQGPGCSSRTWLVPFPAEEGINLQKSYSACLPPVSACAATRRRGWVACPSAGLSTVQQSLLKVNPTSVNMGHCFKKMRLSWWGMWDEDGGKMRIWGKWGMASPAPASRFDPASVSSAPSTPPLSLNIQLTLLGYGKIQFDLARYGLTFYDSIWLGIVSDSTFDLHFLEHRNFCPPYCQILKARCSGLDITDDMQRRSNFNSRAQREERLPMNHELDVNALQCHGLNNL